MPTEYKPFKVSLSDSQRESIVSGIKSKQAVVLRLSKDSLGGDIALPLTQRQINHIEKAKKLNRGAQLTISKTQLRKVRSGGFIPALIAGAIALGEFLAAAAPEMATAALSAGAATVGKHVAEKALGDGIKSDIKKELKKVAKVGVSRSCQKMSKKLISNPIAEPVVDAVCDGLAKVVIGDGCGHKKRKPCAKKSK